MVFDEAQDLFKNFGATPFLATLSAKGNEKQNKGLTNKVLENNQTPVIWITNSIQAMDPAYIRRFDFCLKSRCHLKALKNHETKQAPSCYLLEFIALLKETTLLRP